VLEARIAKARAELARRMQQQELIGVPAMPVKLRSWWATPAATLEKRRAVLALVLDHAVILPANRPSKTVDPARVVPRGRLAGLIRGYPENTAGFYSHQDDSQVSQPYDRGGYATLISDRWKVERSLAWLLANRRLTVRYERRADILTALLQLACALICARKLQPL
jgi:hypothetical protein